MHCVKGRTVVEAAGSLLVKGDLVKNICIFEYKTIASFGCAGMPGGYSVCVFSNGDVVKREFILGDEHPKQEIVLANIPELAKTIRSVIRQHSADLKSIPSSLYNGSDDGSVKYFKFGGKRISALNIHRIDLSIIRQQNPQYYEAYIDNMQFENLVLDIYDEIAKEFNKYKTGIRLEIM